MKIFFFAYLLFITYLFNFIQKEKSFEQSISDGKMIYEDPYYWNVLFYDSEVTNDNCNNVNCIVNSDSESTNYVEHTYENNCCNVHDNNKVKLEIKLNSSFNH